jgi:putative aldouronate transport system substrate-binding protein
MNMRHESANGFFVQSNSTFIDKFYLGDDNQYHWGAASEDTLRGLKLYQEAFREGILNPEFFTIKQDEDIQSFQTTGQTGIYTQEAMATYVQTCSQTMMEQQGLDSDKALHIAITLGEDGKHHQYEVMNFWTSLIFSPNMDEEKFSRIMDLVDYIAEDDTQLFIRMGFKDKDWIEEDGDYKVLWPEGKQLTDIYPSMHPVYGNMIVLSDDFAIINPGYEKRFRDITNMVYATKAQMSDSTTVVRTNWTEYFHDSQAKRMATFNYSEEFAQLITMDGDLQTNWQAWIDEKAPLVNPVIEELNALIN